MRVRKEEMEEKEREGEKIVKVGMVDVKVVQ